MGGNIGTSAMAAAKKKDVKRVRDMEYKAKPEVKEETWHQNKEEERTEQSGGKEG